MELILSGVGTLDKAMGLVAALEEEPKNLAELVEATGLSRATAHRLAVALETHGLVRRQDGRFALGFAWARLGRRFTDTLPLARLAMPVLARLRADTGESVQLYVRDGDRRVCIAALDSFNELRTIVGVGASLPLDRGSGGAVLAQSGPTAPDEWAESVGERAPGVASVSAPVVDRDGAVVAAISVSGPIERLSESPGERFAVPVIEAARSLTMTIRGTR